MAEQGAAERTEKPTGRRLSKTRAKGNVPHSQELTSTVALILLIGVLWFTSKSLLSWSITGLKSGLSCQTYMFKDSMSLVHFMNSTIINSTMVILPLLAALFLGGFLSSYSVGGMTNSSKALEFKWGALNPINGLKNLLNVRSIVNLSLSIVKLVFIAVIVWLYLEEKKETFAALRWAWTAEILTGISNLVLGVVIRICVAMLVISLADTWFQKWKYIEDLKMTKQEVKEEHKQQEGSPETKGRIRRLQYAMATKRMLQEVPKANVVLVNPTHYAVAIKYEAGNAEAPVVVAKGADHMAEKIREIARAYGVPIIRRPELTRTIYASVKLGEMIPEYLFVAVAEVLALIYRLRNRKAT
jgi:flagellar biosynthetic protein FlhB